ncbi:MAG: hypothetical protein EAZ28_06235 [Oscillatoriales cyanobacterium]|nr:MAG: hypothetical protein EAZ28_06235 [Oscillatoriales cyanobacterium]
MLKLLKVLLLRAVVPLLNGANGEILVQEHGTKRATFTIRIQIDVERWVAVAVEGRSPRHSVLARAGG